MTKKPAHLVICPKCSKAVELEDIINHLNSHTTVRKEQQQPQLGGEAQQPSGA